MSAAFFCYRVTGSSIISSISMTYPPVFGGGGGIFFCTLFTKHHLVSLFNIYDHAGKSKPASRKNLTLHSTILCLWIWCSHQILTYPPMALDLTFHPIIMKKEPSAIWAKAYWQFIYLRHIGFSVLHRYALYLYFYFNFICVSLTCSNQPHQWSH